MKSLLFIFALLTGPSYAQQLPRFIDASFFPAGTLQTGDQFGQAVVGFNDFNGDGELDIAVGAPGDDDGGVDRGAVYLVSAGGFTKISSTTPGMAGVLSDSAFFGAGIARIGDLDNDGLSELAVLSRGPSGGTVPQGKVHIVFLDKAALSTGQAVVNALTEINPATDPAFQASPGNCGSPPVDSPTSVGEIGDLDGDGVVDLVVGFANDTDGCIVGGDCQCCPVTPPACSGPVGSVWILFLNFNGTVRACQKISVTCGGFASILPCGGTVLGPLQGCPKFGSSVDGALDRDGDGIRDLIVGSAGDDDGSILGCGTLGGSSGAIWVLHLNSNGTVKSSAKISATSGGLSLVPVAGDLFGSSVSAVGDFDGDGIVDIVAGAPGRLRGEGVNGDCVQAPIPDRSGSSWLILLNANGTVKNQVELNPGCLNLGTDRAIREFGASVAAHSQVEGGGNGVVFGAPLADSSTSSAGTITATGAVFLRELFDPFASAEWTAYQEPVSCHVANSNPNALSCTPPVIGAVWIANVAQILPQHTLANITLKPSGLCPPANTPYGQLWVSGTTLFSMTVGIVSGNGKFLIPIPPDPSLNQLYMTVQGRSFGGGSVKLSNALQLGVGFSYP